jgi:hypothetical protein
VLGIFPFSCTVGGHQDSKGCDHQIDASEVVINLIYSCIQYDSNWSIVFKVTKRTEIMDDKSGVWYLKLWKNHSNSPFLSEPLVFGIGLLLQ